MRRIHGITLVEVVLVIGVLLMIFALGSFAFARFARATAAVSTEREVVNAVTLAARRARSGNAGTAWGVYIPYDETTRTTENIVVFSGTSYATRNTSLDMQLSVSPDITFTSVDFSGSAPDATDSHEIVFAPLTGATTQYGSFTLAWYGESVTVTVNANGIPVR